MSENNNKNKERDLPSRAEKNRRNNNEENNQDNNNQRKYILIIGALLIVFIILLIGIFSGNDSGSESDTDSATTTSSEISSESNTESSSEEETSDESSSETTSESEDETTTSADEQANQAPVDDVEVGDSDLDGAEFSYSGDWDPVGTDQTGEHVTDYSEGSPDRQAIKTASAAVTGLNPDTMIEQWVGNDGTSNGVYATVSNADATEQYRVHLKWIDGQGWQPQTVDVIQN